MTRALHARGQVTWPKATRGRVGKWARWQGTRALHARGHVGKLARWRGELVQGAS